MSSPSPDNPQASSNGREVQLPSPNYGSYLLPLLLLTVALLIAWFVFRPASADTHHQKVARTYWENNLKNADLQLMNNPDYIQRILPDLPPLPKEFYTNIQQINQLDASQSSALIRYFQTAGRDSARFINHYPLAHSFFLKGDYAKAIQFFKKYQQQFDQRSSPFQDTEFFLLLSYIANGADELITAPLLQSIADNPNHRFHNSVKTLQQAM